MTLINHCELLTGWAETNSATMDNFFPPPHSQKCPQLEICDKSPELLRLSFDLLVAGIRSTFCANQQQGCRAVILIAPDAGENLMGSLSGKLLFAIDSHKSSVSNTVSHRNTQSLVFGR